MEFDGEKTKSKSDNNSLHLVKKNTSKSSTPNIKLDSTNGSSMFEQSQITQKKKNSSSVKDDQSVSTLSVGGFNNINLSNGENEISIAGTSTSGGKSSKRHSKSPNKTKKGNTVKNSSKTVKKVTWKKDIVSVVDIASYKEYTFNLSNNEGKDKDDENISCKCILF